VTNQRSDYYLGSVLAISYSKAEGFVVNNPLSNHAAPDRSYDFTVYVYCSDKADIVGYSEAIMVSANRIAQDIADPNNAERGYFSIYTSFSTINISKANATTNNGYIELALGSVFTSRSGIFNKQLSISKEYAYPEDDDTFSFAGRRDYPYNFNFSEGTDTFTKMIGSYIVDKLELSVETLIGYVVSMAPPKDISIVLEGNKELAYEVLGSNVRNWRNVALSYSTGFSCSPDMAVAIPVIVSYTEDLDNFIPYSKYYRFITAEKNGGLLGSLVYEHEIDPVESNGVYVLTALRNLNNFVYHASDMTSRKRGDLSTGSSRARGSSVIAALGGITTTSIGNLYNFINDTESIDKDKFSRYKLPSDSLATINSLYTDKVHYARNNNRSDLFVSRIASMFMILSVVSRVLYNIFSKADFEKSFGITKESLGKSLFDRGQMRSRLVRSFKEMAEEFNCVLTNTNPSRVTKVNVKRATLLINFFKTTEHSRLLNGWIFNEVAVQKLFVPEYCMQVIKLYPRIFPEYNILIDDKNKHLLSIHSNIDSSALTSNGYSSSSREFCWYLVLPMVYELINNSGDFVIDNKYVERLHRQTVNTSSNSDIQVRDYLLTMDEIIANCSTNYMLSDSFRANTLSLATSCLIHTGSKRSAWSIIDNPSRQNSGYTNGFISDLHGVDSYISMPSVWTKEFLESVKLGVLTGSNSDTLYKVILAQLTKRLARFSASLSSHGIGILQSITMSDRSYTYNESKSKLGNWEYISAIKNAKSTDNSIEEEPAIGFGFSDAVGVFIVMTKDPAKDIDTLNFLTNLTRNMDILERTDFHFSNTMLRYMVKFPVEDYIDSNTADNILIILKYFRTSVEKYKIYSGTPTLMLNMFDECISKITKFKETTTY
jgi:hypothetical protein